MRIRFFAIIFTAISIALSCSATCLRGEQVDVEGLLKSINAVSTKGEGHRKAMAAWNRLVRADTSQLISILAGVDEENRLAVNWIRAAVDSIAQKRIAAGGELPMEELKTFLADTSHAPRARLTAFELIRSADPDTADMLVPGFLNDPSSELRRDAVAVALKQAETASSSGDNPTAVARYQTALNAARDLDQVQDAAKNLRELGQTVDLPTHFGFIMSWKLIGPFDNVDMGGFDVAYGPEQRAVTSVAFRGKEGQVEWVAHTTEDELGVVDLNKALSKFKGAIAYAYAEFESDQARDVELRIGCINGNKIWLNGQLLTANHVYHSGSFLDQYKGIGQLKKGKNIILLKIAQNEQTEDWAQRWQFQLRACDKYGTAVLAADR